MSNLRNIKKYGIAYVYSEVSVGENKFLIPFDGCCIPMKYEELKEISDNLTKFFKTVSKAEYEIFYNNLVLEETNRDRLISEQYKKELNEEKKKREKEYFEKFDYNISKEILPEEKIEEFLNKCPLYPVDFIDSREIHYPVIINFYNRNALIKTVSCSKNFLQTLANVKTKYVYDAYSYSYIPEKYIGQVLEYIILFKKPVHTSSMTLKNYVVYCPLSILIKRLNKDRDYIFRRDKLLKLLEKNRVKYFERDGRIIVDGRAALYHVGNFLSGIQK